MLSCYNRRSKLLTFCCIYGGEDWVSGVLGKVDLGLWVECLGWILRTPNGLFCWVNQTGIIALL